MKEINKENNWRVDNVHNFNQKLYIFVVILLHLIDNF